MIGDTTTCTKIDGTKCIKDYIDDKLDEVKQHAAAAAAAAAPPSIKFMQGGASTQIVFDGSALTVPGYCRQADCDSFATQGSLDATIAQHNALEAVVDSIKTRVAALEANAVAHSGLILANQNNISNSNNSDEIMDNTADIAANTVPLPTPATPRSRCL